MTEHKYTDEEVIKALECCVIGIGAVCQCRECPLYYKTETYSQCKRMLVDGICDLINRQKAEIEEQDRAIINALHRMRQIRAEAIKEFAEKLKKELTTGAAAMRVSTLDIINDLVKELTEEKT